MNPTALQSCGERFRQLVEQGWVVLYLADDNAILESPDGELRKHIYLANDTHAYQLNDSTDHTGNTKTDGLVDADSTLGTALTSTQEDTVSTDDDYYVRVTDTGTGFLTAQLNAHFLIAESVDSITQIYVVVKAKTLYTSGTKRADVKTDSGHDILGNLGTLKTSLTKTITTGFGDYLDASNKFHARVYHSYYLAGFHSVACDTYYIEVEITYIGTPAAPSGLSVVTTQT